MLKRLMVVAVAWAAGLAFFQVANAQVWNSHGMIGNEQPPQTGPAPKRDMTGTWDAGGAGIAPRGSPTSALTAWGEKKVSAYRPGDGPRAALIGEINDPLSTMCDPAGFPRNLLFELRPFQVVHTPNQVLMLYMFEKRFRTIWTDGRALPKDPDPRWYGYSIGRWEDDFTFVVETIGMDEKTWLDNAGNPHSNDMRVEERYRRVNMGTMELTVTIDDPTAYTKPWVARKGLPLRLIPSNVDLMEMICSATEAQEYKKNMGK
ncbi:MAG TPA: hypothetical protein VFO58_14525 [Vicinamibacterales bacterium]|nr:hypothetical protein [Vicinamibacterales bacterium]